LDLLKRLKQSYPPRYFPRHYLPEALTKNLFYKLEAPRVMTESNRRVGECVHPPRPPAFSGFSSSKNFGDHWQFSPNSSFPVSLGCSNSKCDGKRDLCSRTVSLRVDETIGLTMSKLALVSVRRTSSMNWRYIVGMQWISQALSYFRSSR